MPGFKTNKASAAVGVLAAVMHVCLWPAVVRPEPLVLVADGVAHAPIVLPADAPAETARAARQLADYMEKISGVRPEVWDGAPDPAPAPAIWVGMQPQVPERFPEIDTDFRHPEEILIVCTGRDVLIAGRDRIFGDAQTEYGTANAVYTFIEKHLDVRWLWPGELGEDIVPSGTIAVPAGTYRFHPPFMMRGIFRRPGGVLLDWARCQRIALDSLVMDIGHAFSDWWEKYHAAHPDYFALQPDGTRSGYPRPNTAKLCESNPAVWEQWWSNVAATVGHDPLATIFSAAPNDGSNAGICICDSCRAWDHPEGRPWRMRWSGLTYDYLAMTDRYVKFWNTLARGLKEKFPDRDYHVSGMAYGPARPPPVEARLADNIVIGYVGHFPLAGELVREREKEDWLEWAAKAPKLMFRPNMFWYSGGFHGLPSLATRYTIEDFRFLAENSGVGLAIDTTPRHWATQGPQYYVMAQFAWNPFQDGAALLDDYYRRGFGPAAEKIRRYFELMEEAHVAILNTPGWRHSMGAIRQPLTEFILAEFNSDRLDQAAALLDAAAALAGAGPDIYGQRVGFVRTGLEYTRVLVETLAAMTVVRDTGGKDRAAVKKALALCEQRETIFERYDGLAINGYLFNITWASSRNLEDYVGPPADEFLQAAGLMQVCRWTGAAGDGLWGNPGNWERQTGNQWVRAETPPGGMAQVMLADLPDNQTPQRITLDAPVELERLTMAAAVNAYRLIAADEDCVLVLTDGQPLVLAARAAQSMCLEAGVLLAVDGRATLVLGGQKGAQIAVKRPLRAPGGLLVRGEDKGPGMLELKAGVESPVIHVAGGARVFLNSDQEFDNFRTVDGTLLVRRDTFLARTMNQFGGTAVLRLQGAGTNDVVVSVGNITRRGRYELEPPLDDSSGRLILRVGTIDSRAGRAAAPVIRTAAGTFVELGGDQPGPMRADLAAGIHGDGGMIKTGTSDIRRGLKNESLVGERNTYTGGTFLKGGTLRLIRNVIPERDVVGGGAPDVEYDGCLGPGPLEVFEGAVFDLNGLKQTVAGLKGAGTVQLNGGTLILPGPPGLDFTGEIKGPGTLVEGGTRKTVEK